MEFSTYDGTAEISKDNCVPFHFENGEIEFYLGRKLCTFKEGMTSIVGQKHKTSDSLIFFHFPIPLENAGMVKHIDETGEKQERPISIGTIRHPVDFYIEKYDELSEFKEIRFEFSELDYL